MEYDGNVLDAYKQYFSALETMGTYPKDNTYGLLIYSFIVDQIFDGPLSVYLDDEGLSALNKAIRCIANNGCLIANPGPFTHISKPRGTLYSEFFHQTMDNLPIIIDEDMLKRLSGNINIQ